MAAAIEKAWGVFEADSTPVALDSRNISGVTQNGTGDYTVTTTLDFSANGVNYMVYGTCAGSGASQEQIDVVIVDDHSVRVRTHADGTPIDVNFSLLCVSVSA